MQREEAGEDAALRADGGTDGQGHTAPGAPMRRFVAAQVRDDDATSNSNFVHLYLSKVLTEDK